jgi:membrane protein implicated in regulation of membrane protease activity
MKRNTLLVIIGLTTVLVGGGLLIAGTSPALAIVLGAIAAFLVFVLWEPPPKHITGCKFQVPQNARRLIIVYPSSFIP